AHRDAARSVITAVGESDPDLFEHYEANDDHRAIFYRSQCLHGLRRKHLILSGIPKKFKCLIERHEKGDGSQIYERQERIEIHRKERFACVHAFGVGLPQEERESANAEQYNDDLEKHRRTPLHRYVFIHAFSLIYHLSFVNIYLSLVK